MCHSFNFLFFYRTSDNTGQYIEGLVNFNSCTTCDPAAKPQHYGLCVLLPRCWWHTAEAGSSSALCKPHLPNAPERAIHYDCKVGWEGTIAGEHPKTLSCPLLL